MAETPLADRVLAFCVTAVSVIAVMGLLALDALWLLGESVPVTGRQLLEVQIAPFMAFGLMALAAWTSRRDRRRSIASTIRKATPSR